MRSGEPRRGDGVCQEALGAVRFLVGKDQLTISALVNMHPEMMSVGELS